MVDASEETQTVAEPQTGGKIYTITDEMLIEKSVEDEKMEKFGFTAPDSENIDCLTVLSKLMNQSERFEEMLIVMKRIIKLSKGQLTTDQLNHIAICFKNLLCIPRNAIKSAFQKLEPPGSLVSKFQDSLKNLVIAICSDAVKTATYVLERCDDDSVECILMSHKILADYYRYWAEISISPSSKSEEIVEIDVVKKAEYHYGKSSEIAEFLDPMHYLRLGVVLNRSVFYYEICQLKDKALEMASKAVCEAERFYNSLEAPDPKKFSDATGALKLLRDNISVWSSHNTGYKMDGADIEDNEEDDGSDDELPTATNEDVIAPAPTADEQPQEETAAAD